MSVCAKACAEYFATLTAVFGTVPDVIASESGDISKSKKGKFHATIKAFISQILVFMAADSAMGPDALNICLGGLPKWIPLLVNYPESRKKLAERLVQIWASEGSDQARLAALLAIHKAASLYPKLLDRLLKKMYQAFGKACRSLSVHTMGTATFMLNGLVEVYALDAARAEVFAGKALRQLAALLQTGIKHPSKESLNKIYCWSFVWSVKFLARLVAQCKTLRGLQAKVLGLIQTSLCYNFVPRFYPFHYHLISAASEVCKASQAFFPSTPCLLQVLARIVSTATKVETGKPKIFDFTTLCKVPRTESVSRSYLDLAAEEALFLIGEALIGFAHAPSFPELAYPVAAQLRAIEAINRTWKVSKLCATLALKLEQHALAVAELRGAAGDCAPSRTPLDTRLELPAGKDVLELFHRHTHRVREQRRKLVASATDLKTYSAAADIGDSDVEQAAARKPARPAADRAAKGKREQPARAEEDDFDAGLKAGVLQILESAKKQPKTAKRSKRAAAPLEDVLEDFDISDF